MSTAAADASAAPPGRWFYGWTLVLALGVTETVSYGILQYAFPVFIAPMGAELGWSMAAVTGAFSLATLVSAAAAVPAGRWVDRHGPRGLMTAGSVLAALLLLGWSRVRTIEGFYAALRRAGAGDGGRAVRARVRRGRQLVPSAARPRADGADVRRRVRERDLRAAGDAAGGGARVAATRSSGWPPSWP